jgi:hypothetical protein
MPARPQSLSLDPESRTQAAKELFNYNWTLLEKPDRTANDDDMMVGAAHASRLFWDEVGTAVHRVRGEWLISRVYATLGRAEPSLHHARRCLGLCEIDGIGGFDLAFAYEATARAQAVAGNAGESARYEEQARASAASISDKEDRDLLLADLDTLPR